MRRLVAGALVGLAAGMLLGAACGLHAQEWPTDETLAVADEAGVDALDLQGAVNTTGLEPREYLIGVGELAAPPPPPATTAVHVYQPPPPAAGWPIGGALGWRIWCIEGIESSHGVRMWNPVPWPPPYYDQHAQGWLGWLPTTARAWGAQIGNRASEWFAAARMLAAGYGRQFFGVAAGRC
jgi:hypothetical protein